MARMHVFPVLRIPAYHGDGPMPPYFDDAAIGDSPYLLFSRQESGPAGRNDNFDIHLPDGSRHGLPTYVRLLGEYGVAESDGIVDIYSLRTGKKLQTLTVPSRERSEVEL